MSTPDPSAEAELSTRTAGAPARSRHQSIRRIREIAALVDARSYLEIGVFRGVTFNAVEFQRKVAVDPNFQFDTEEFAAEGVAFHEMTSDEYFVTVAEPEPFDVIFLDGLHTFQQTFRDFCATQALAHSRTVWLIDDVVPVDLYSAWPDKTEAVAGRREAGGTSPAWHGDVFRVVFAIHDFFPVMTYRTIEGSGNPQAVVWREPRKPFQPVLNSLEAIERLSFFEMRKRKDVMMPSTEDEAISRVAEALKR